MITKTVKSKNVHRGFIVETFALKSGEWTFESKRLDGSLIHTNDEPDYYDTQEEAFDAGIECVNDFLDS